ncbi:SOS response-associated peptidase family protein [Edaphobacter sp. HDX4]|uniref:SOS response-associated peptidase family protein n=1 Tax=Edaphobacter sp. HDX4 TaxID=2794064 RepID=UPI002FE63E1A
MTRWLVWRAMGLACHPTTSAVHNFDSQMQITGQCTFPTAISSFLVSQRIPQLWRASRSVAERRTPKPPFRISTVAFHKSMVIDFRATFDLRVQFHIIPIHNRMPVILHEGDFGRWLDREPTPQPPIDLLCPFPSDEMESFEVSKDVGNVRNNSAELLDRA